MHKPQYENNQDDFVEQKVRRRVARKVLQDLHQQADEIEQQAVQQEVASRRLLPVLTLLLALLVFAGLIQWWML